MPIGQPEFVREYLELKNQEHEILFQQIPWLNNFQAAWLLLLMCASTRASYWLRAVRPDLTDTFAEHHDDNVSTCMRTILGTPSSSRSGEGDLHFVPLGGRIGVGQRTTFQGRRPLGKLG